MLKVLPGSAAVASLAPVIQSVLDAVIVIDGEGIIVAWNEIATRSFGWTRDEAVGQCLGELIIPPQHRASHRSGMARYQRTGEASVLNRRIEITALDKSGREFPVELAIVAAPATGTTLFVGFLRDISERRRAEERLTLSEESLRLATDAAEIGTWDLDPIADVLTWSARTKAMFGLSPDEPCSMDDFYAGVHPDDRAATSRAFASALDPVLRQPYDVQYRTVGRADGIVRWVAAKGKGIFDEHGRCIRAVGTAIDISARKICEARHAFMLELADLLRSSDTTEALTQASALMGRYFGVTRVGYGHLDPFEDVFDYSVCWTDGSVSPLLGPYPARAFGAKIVAKLTAGETVVVDDLQEASISDEPETRATASAVDTRAILVVPFVRAGRLRTIIYLNDRLPRRWKADDITFVEEVAERTRQVMERAEAEAALRELNATLEARVEQRTADLRATEEALRQSQKMDAVGRLTGGIAHDFNNLLMIISGNLEVASRRLPAGVEDRVRRAIANAMQGAERASALTSRLLAFSRQQPLAPRTFDANELVAGMSDLLSRALGETILLDTTLCPDLWPAKADPNALENCILNLAVNARDAMPEGGRLTIRTTNRVTGAEQARNFEIPPGDYVCVAVADTGTGMSSETLRRAFEPFFTTKPVDKGTGLGLSMVYGFVKQSGGAIDIVSGLGCGTTVTMLLPRADREVGDRASAERDYRRAGRPSETILVVEDDPGVRSVSVDNLRDLGYTVLEAENGPAALDLIERQPVRLLFSDVVMPGMSGPDLAEAALALRPNLRFLLTSGYTSDKIRDIGAGQAKTDILAKPFTIAQLAERVRQLLDTPDA